MSAVPVFANFSESSRQANATLLTYVETLGPLDVQEKKTCLHLAAGKAAFLGVHPRKNGVRINLVLDRPLVGDRIVKAEKVSKNRFHNEVDFGASDQIDPELATWIAEAYRLQTSTS